jgi:spore maturation protein CgeB
VSPQPLDIVIVGLSITSSWGNGHATTYRCLVSGLHARGHRVHFLERDVPWYAAHRDLPEPPYGRTSLYASPDELFSTHGEAVRNADLVIVGSYVPDGIAIGDWVLAEAGGAAAFYDIDTPVTLARLRRDDIRYLAPRQIGEYDLYLSFTGGPTLRRLESEYGSPKARPLFCSADPELYHPGDDRPGQPPRYDFGYMGTYSVDRQPVLDRLLLEPARRWPAGHFIIAGPRYPDGIVWPDSVERVEHLPPEAHPDFYRQQRFTLNVTRADMVDAGYSPSVRLFEAAACATPVVSDAWDGLEDFFTPGKEILLSRSAEETLQILTDFPEEERRALGDRARARLLAEHTPVHRAEALEGYALEVLSGREGRQKRPVSTS